MPLNTLAKLITSYRWLLEERDSQEKAKADENARYIDKEIDELFLRIVKFPTNDQRISIAQIEFLVTTLAEEHHAPLARAALRETIMQHVGRLAAGQPDRIGAYRATSPGAKA